MCIWCYISTVSHVWYIASSVINFFNRLWSKAWREDTGRHHWQVRFELYLQVHHGPVGNLFILTYLDWPNQDTDISFVCLFFFFLCFSVPISCLPGREQSVFSTMSSAVFLWFSFFLNFVVFLDTFELLSDIPPFCFAFFFIFFVLSGGDVFEHSGDVNLDRVTKEFIPPPVRISSPDTAHARKRSSSSELK